MRAPPLVTYRTSTIWTADGDDPYDEAPPLEVYLATDIDPLLAHYAALITALEAALQATVRDAVALAHRKGA
jgi:hypothetical protein